MSRFILVTALALSGTLLQADGLADLKAALKALPQASKVSARIEEEIAALGVRGRLICGRRVEVELEEGRVPAFPVAVHDLREPDSLLLQRAGLGRGQAVGCGLLVPHKTIVAAE